MEEIATLAARLAGNGKAQGIPSKPLAIMMEASRDHAVIAATNGRLFLRQQGLYRLIKMENTYKEVKHCIVFLLCLFGPWVLIDLIWGWV